MSLRYFVFLTSVVTADYTYFQIFGIHNNTDRKDNRNMQTNNESKQNPKKEMMLGTLFVIATIIILAIPTKRRRK